MTRAATSLLESRGMPMEIAGLKVERVTPRVPERPLEAAQPEAS